MSINIADTLRKVKLKNKNANCLSDRRARYRACRHRVRWHTLPFSSNFAALTDSFNLTITTMSSTHQQDLETWVKEKLESLYLNKVDGDFDSYFDSVFAPDVQLTVNDESATREQFKQDLKNFQFAAMSGSVDWEHVDVKPKDEEKPNDVSNIEYSYI